VKSATGEPIGQATGFSIDGNKIITNEHVVRGGTPCLDLGAVRVGLKVVRTDPVNDLAVLLPDGELSSVPLKLAASQPKPGTAVFAIGNPSGLERSISTGVVAGIRTMHGHELLQISAPISPGSSGSPILTANGEVVGVAVGMLDDGQNLNFAVPSSVVLRFLNGETSKPDITSLLSKAGELSKKRWTEMEYSSETGSPFQRAGAEIEDLLFRALEMADSDSSSLAAVFDEALQVRSPLAVTASERLVATKPSADAYFRLARSLKMRFASEAAQEPENPTLKRAEAAIRLAFKETRQPTIEMYAVLADILEDRSLFAESRTSFAKTYELATSRGNEWVVVDALHGLVRTNYSLQAFAESDRYFQLLVETGQSNAVDWRGQGARQYARKEYKNAGDSYKQAAPTPAFWENWCRAANAYSRAVGAEDNTLEAARACIKNGADKKDSDGTLASAHFLIASVLNGRGVYEEALSHSREAAAIDPSDASYQDTLADSFMGLRRFQEAINAIKQAIRLSDGKYAWTHFTLGSAYFETENWQLAEDSFQKAAELNKEDYKAPYNVALCLEHLGYHGDAVSWYEETLRRNPNQERKQEILKRIQIIRQ
jgi:tetratricopeptide (TPR) repeat protein